MFMLSNFKWKCSRNISTGNVVLRLSERLRLATKFSKIKLKLFSLFQKDAITNAKRKTLCIRKKMY